VAVVKRRLEKRLGHAPDATAPRGPDR
jgi:hypothetical protein